MMRRLTPVLLLLLAVPQARAQEAPERLLSADTQIYLRWDGIEKHQAVFDKSALGQILKGDTGQFLIGLMTDIQENQLLKLGKSVAAQGFVMGVEVRRIDADQPPDANLILVLPGKAQWEPFFAAMTWSADEAKLDIKEIEVMKRTVYTFKNVPVGVAWWKEGNDAVLVVSSESADAAVKRVLGKTPRLTENASFKKVDGFKEFKTCARGYVDLASLIKLTRKVDPQASKAIDDLGLEAFKDLTFFYGFDGAATRSLIACDITGPRKGLAQLVNGKPFGLEELPPLPTDMVSFTALRFDAGALFDGSVALLEKLLPPDQAKQVKGGIAMADKLLGISIRDDLIGSLGTLLVTYASPPEGAMFFGQALLIQVKDAKKLQTALEMTVKGVSKLVNTDVQVKTRTYRGVKLNTIQVKERGFILAPTYAIHKDWLVIGLFPQPVQGYVLRSSAELPAWKASATVKASLEKLPSKFNMLTVTDPRPGVNTILSLAPLVAAAIQSELHDAKIDLSGLPNAHEVTRHLFPNVTVASDDGKTWRMESLTSLPMPPGLGSVDNTVMISMIAITTIGRSASATFQAVGQQLK